MLALGGCAWLDNRQRQIIYRPTSGQPADFPGLRSGDKRYFVSLPGTGTPQRLALWWLPQARQDAPTLLYLHGTFRNLFDNLHKIDALRAAGFSVLALDYRGWGESSPLTPSEQTIVQDAWVAWAELKKHQPDAAKRLIYGHSMGSAVAVELASQLHSPADYGGLVLESAFTSFADVAREAGWLARLLYLFSHERFDSLDKIAKVHAPLLMLHGSLDDTVPIRLGQRLFAAANPPKQWLTVNGAAHSDLDLVNPALYQTTLHGFATTYLPGSP
ncbi:2-hydroxy-6-oxononadienedioate/2-hydroxy-6-oxononatrienedioate hydrolase [mine drainage metagenome]|uniref:2-hydroxy-6-oxononadienedioate/2-hydroxy-6-oxononatrienedioate hydrolase n=1 Tax=mine drainage metagenome TaxID=410659 RepID=A0A1J5PNU8_9ZZZZ